MREREESNGKVDLAVACVVGHVPVERIFLLRLHCQTVAVITVTHVAVVTETILDHFVANGKKVGNRLGEMG